MTRNRYSFTAIICLILGVFSVLPSVVQGFEISARVETPRVTKNEEVTLIITTSGERSDIAPTLPELDDFQQLGTASTFSSVEINQGRISSTNEYHFTLRPKKMGQLTIPPIEVHVKGETYRTDPITVTVYKSSLDVTENDNGVNVDHPPEDLFVSASIDNKEIYVGEQVTLTLAVYSRINFSSPSIKQMPSFTGFWTKDIHTATSLHWKKVKVQDLDYKASVIRIIALFPTSAGEITIDPFAMQFGVREVSNRKRRSRWDPFADPFFGDSLFQRHKTVVRQTQPIKINVKPLPETGRPAQFTGAVGNFELKASIDKQQLMEDEPITLQVVISGKGNIQTLTAPSLPDLGNLETYNSTSSEKMSINATNLIGGNKIYEYVLIPRSSGEAIIPEISFNFFNPDDDRYHSLKTNPFQIIIDKNPLKDRFKKEDGRTVYREGVKLITRDIQFIKSVVPLSGSRSPLLMRPWFIILQFLPFGLLLAAMYAKKHMERLKTDIPYARSRFASKQARKHLKNALEYLKNGNSDQYFGEIHRALSRFIADKFNISSSGITEDDLKQHFIQKKYPEHMLSEVLKIFEQCNQARFSPTDIPQETKQALFDRTSSVISEIEKHHV